MKHQTGILKIIIAGIALSGCTQEKWQDGLESPVEVHFSTTALSSRAEKAESDKLSTDAKVRVYTYRVKEGVKDTIAINNYKADTSNPQLLTPVSTEGTASEMILPSGTFNFYAVSTNSDTQEVPAFHTDDAVNGVPSADKGKVAVANGVDYLYASTLGQPIAFGTDVANIPLAFKHVGAQVQLTIKFGDGAHAESEDAAKDFNLAKVSIQATSESNAFMHLYDGQILFNGNQTQGSPGADTDLKEMVVTRSGTAVGATPADQVATYHILPLAGETGRKMKIVIVIDNLVVGTAAATHTYTGFLNAEAGWKVGTSNQYTLTLSGTEIKFSPVTVKPWVTGTGGEVGDITDSSTSTEPNN